MDTHFLHVFCAAKLPDVRKIGDCSPLEGPDKLTNTQIRTPIIREVNNGCPHFLCMKTAKDAADPGALFGPKIDV